MLCGKCQQLFLKAHYLYDIGASLSKERRRTSRVNILSILATGCRDMPELIEEAWSSISIKRAIGLVSERSRLRELQECSTSSASSLDILCLLVRSLYMRSRSALTSHATLRTISKV